MKMRTIAAIALSGSILGLTGVAHADVTGTAKLFFEGDMVRGGQPGAPGPVCVLDNQFKHLEKVVWRFRVLDQNGKALDGTGLKSLVVELPDGQKVNAQYGPHPGPANPTDFFWTAIWIIPSAYPNGTSSIRRPRLMRRARPQPGSRSSGRPRNCRGSPATSRSRGPDSNGSSVS